MLQCLISGAEAYTHTIGWDGVRFTAAITVRELCSEVRQDWKQLIGRKLAHVTAVKTGLGERPKE
jgi:hypothetical protein